MAIYKSLRYIYFLAITASLGGFTTGFFFTNYNAASMEIEDLLERQKDKSEIIIGLIQSLIPLGALVGGVLSGPLAGWIGRRPSLLITDLLTVIGCILTIVGEDIVLVSLLIGRFICGLTVGFNWTIVTLFIRETSPANLSGRTGGFFMVLFATGILTAYLLSLIMPTNVKEKNQEWRVIFAFPGIIAIIRAALFMFVFKLDTPRFYILKDQDESAQNVLRKIYKEEYVTAIYEKEKKTPRITNIREFFTGRFKRQFRLACTLIAIFQLTGINVVTFYSSAIFLISSSETHIIEVRVLNILIGLIRVICSLFAGALADKFGRRSLFLGGLVLMTLSLFFIGLFGELSFLVGVKIMMLFFMIANGFTFATILPTYMAEILPLSGCGYAVSFENLLVFLITLIYPLIVQDQASSDRLYILFFMCGIIGIGGFVYVLLRVKETKGKKDIEIYNEFNTEGGDVGLLDEDMLETLNSQGVTLTERSNSASSIYRPIVN